MKRRFAIALALVACLTLGSVSLAIGKPGVKKVDTTVTLTYAQTGTPPYHQSVFSGQVKAKKSCKKAREITVRNTGTGAVVGTTTSTSNGSYSISTSAAPAGTYQAEAAKKVRKQNNGTKIVCKAGTSNTVTVQ